MASNISPNIITDGLVIYLDSNNIKSYPGEPTTNVFASYSLNQNYNDNATGVLGGWAGNPSYNGTYLMDPNTKVFGTHCSVIKCGLPNVYFTHGPITLSSSTTYILSAYMKVNPGGNTADSNWIHISSGPAGTVFSWVPAGITTEWKRFSKVFTMPANSTGTYNLRTYNYTAGTWKYINAIQVEQKPHITPFVSGTRPIVGGWRDLSGNANHADLTNTVYDSNAIPNFDGTIGHSIDIPNIDLRTDFTLEAWVKLNAISGSAIFGHGSTLATKGLHIVFLSNTSIRFGMYANDTDYTVNINTGTWYHFAFTYKHSTPYTKKMYINGVEISGTPLQTQAAYTSTPTALRIGRTYGTYNSSNPTNGRIEQIKMYTRVLSVTDVAQNFAAHRSLYGV